MVYELGARHPRTSAPWRLERLVGRLFPGAGDNRVRSVELIRTTRSHSFGAEQVLRITGLKYTITVDGHFCIGSWRRQTGRFIVVNDNYSVQPKILITVVSG